MRRFLFACLALAVTATAMPSTSTGQDFAGTKTADLLFNPNVPSVWHKLGIPQGVGRTKKFLESKINRKGNHPERESKPRLLKLTDPANLMPEMPESIKIAAKIKKEEDLVPQKIKALAYLGKIGCGCHNKKLKGMVTNALLEAMEDCNADVRTAALTAVLSQVKGNCSCSCESSCNPDSCCSESIYKKLEEMAYKADKSGCPTESDPAVRALASQVLSACPFPKDDGGGSEIKPDEPKGVKPLEGGDTTSSRRSLMSKDAYVVAENVMMKQLEVTGVVRSVENENATIVFDRPYKLPAGQHVVVATDRSHASFGVIETAKNGSAVIKLDDSKMLAYLQSGPRIKLGLLQ